MSGYTPTTDEIRNVWGEFSEYGGLTNRTSGGSLIDARYAEFDRWLATHDRDIQAQALREVADVWQRGAWADAPRRADRVQERIANGEHVSEWLRERAGRLADTTEETAPTHVGGRVNAEDCPACSAALDPPPYPWICPGPNEAEGTTT